MVSALLSRLRLDIGDKRYSKDKLMLEITAIGIRDQYVKVLKRLKEHATYY